MGNLFLNNSLEHQNVVRQTEMGEKSDFPQACVLAGAASTTTTNVNRTCSNVFGWEKRYVFIFYSFHSIGLKFSGEVCLLEKSLTSWNESGWCSGSGINGVFIFSDCVRVCCVVKCKS